jgi:hypothetical protein
LLLISNCTRRDCSRQFKNIIPAAGIARKNPTLKPVIDSFSKGDPMKIDSRILNIQENVKQLSDKSLINQTDFLTEQERGITILVLRHLREIEVRRLFVDLGFSSMYECCIKRFKYSEGQTQRRLSSARLMTELPEIEARIQTGGLNVTNLSKVQSFMKAEKSVNHNLSKQDKLALIAQLENMPTRQVEKELIERSHQPALLAEKFHRISQVLSGTTETHATSNSVMDLSPQFTKFEALLDSEHLELLKEFKNLYAHELKDSGNISVLSFLLKNAVHLKKKKLGENQKRDQNSNAQLPSAPKVISENTKVDAAVPKKSARKPLKISIKKAVWQREQGCCEHIDKESKQRCASKHAVQTDHIIAVALGGTNDLPNLQLLCRAHNSRRSIKTFGIFRK